MKLLFMVGISLLMLSSCSVPSTGQASPTGTSRSQVTQSTNTPSLTIVTPSPSDIPTDMITPTPSISTSTPTSTTPTPIDVSRIDLASILRQMDGLESDITAGQITNSLPAMYNGIEQPLKQIYEEFNRDGNSTGGIAILISSSWSNATANYAILRGYMGGLGNTLEVSGLGNEIEDARISPPGTKMEGGIDVTDLVFQRCNAVIQMHILGEVNRESVISYAKNLDSLLIPSVCT